MSFPGSYQSDGHVSGVQTRSDPIYDSLTSGRGWQAAPTSAGITVGPRSALTLASYFAAINVLSTDLACLPIKEYRARKSGGRDPVTDSARSEFLSVSPDGETTPMRQRQSLYGHMLGHGNGYAELDFAGGELAGIYLLDPLTQPDRRTQDNRMYYRLPDGSTRPPYKILHFAGLGYDGLCGYSVARMARQAIALGLAAETFGASFFGNGTTPSGVFTSPGRMGGDAIKNFRDSINAMHQGPGNAHKFMVLEQGMTWLQTSINPDDAQFLATRQFQVSEICRLFRLPPHKLCDYTHAHLSNIESANIDYMTTVLMPWCVSIEQEMNRKLFTAEERRAGFYVENQMQAFLRGDMNSRSTFYERMMGLSVMSPNDIAQLENFNPLGSDGDKRFLSVQLQPIEAVLNPPTPTPDLSGNPPGDVPAALNSPRFSGNGSNGHGR